MRIAILGNSGSGKSSLAHQLAQQHGLSVLDLDTIYWEPDQPAVARPTDKAIAALNAFMDAADHWVIEGCYEGLIHASFEYQPKLIFLDPGEARCLQNCQARPWEPHKYASKAEQDARLPMLLNWVADYYVRDGNMSHAKHLAVYEQYSGDKEVLSAFALENES